MANHPEGRIIIALRICSRIEDITSERLKPTDEEFSRALATPFRHGSRQLLAPIVGDLSKVQEHYYPSKETFDLAHMIFTRFVVTENDNKDN